MSSEIAIKVEGLSKCYHIYEQPRDRLKQYFIPRLQRFMGKPIRNYYREFWALKDVSFEVKRGETIGVIGRNGSGKSTLLQMICGTLNPTCGSINANGRIAALLELGSGFNPEFSGRDNVFMNGSLLGLSQEDIEERLHKILDFADIGNFIDQPVKTYSSGMMVRLAFAVQAQVSPDILVVDEALAVGDAKFQAKCFERLRQLKEEGTSILLVTHSSEQIVTHCSRAILLDAGQPVECGEPRHVVNRYMDILFGKEKITTKKIQKRKEVNVKRDGKNFEVDLSKDNDVFSTRPGYNHHEYRWGDGAAEILDFCLIADGEVYPSSVTSGQFLELRVSVRFLTALSRPILGITIKTREGVTVYGTNSENLALDSLKSIVVIGSVVEVSAAFVCRLASGDYFLSLGVATREGEGVIPHDRRYDAIHIQVRSEKKFFGLIDLDLKMTATSDI